jgi:hypothetical protein
MRCGAPALGFWRCVSGESEPELPGVDGSSECSLWFEWHGVCRACARSPAGGPEQRRAVLRRAVRLGLLGLLCMWVGLGG